MTVSMSDCATMLKALADPTRLSVVRLLLRGDYRVSEIHDQIGEVEQSLLSHHLKILRDVGIVRTRRDGRFILYQLAPDFRIHTRTHGLDFGCCKLTF